MQGVVPQPTLPDVTLDETDYAGKTKRKAEGSGMSQKWDDEGVYPSARKCWHETAIE